MDDLSPTTYLVTGATRGIGRALIDVLSQRSHVHVIAGVRDIKHPSAQALASKTNVSLVEIDALRDSTPAAAARQLESDGTQAIDVVIANAGIVSKAASLANTLTEDLREIINVNAVAPVLLFAAFRPFLLRSANPRLLVISSKAGAFSHQDDLFNSHETIDGKPNPKFGAYAASKTTSNILTKRIALEEPWLTAIPVHPGLVVTDMTKAGFGADALQSFAASGHAQTPEQCASAIIQLAENAKQSLHSGKFYDVQSSDFCEF